MKEFRDRVMDYHHDQLRRTTPCVNSSPCRHKAQKNRRRDYERLVTDRKIMQENRVLLLKLAGVAQTSLGVDIGPPRQGATSNKNSVESMEKRKLEVANYKILKRIVTAKKTLSVQKWDKEENQRQKLLRQMTEFPVAYKPSAVLSNISGEGWRQPASRPSRPATAKSRRENAWHSSTADADVPDCNALLGERFVTPVPTRRPENLRRPKTADSLCRKGACDGHTYTQRRHRHSQQKRGEDNSTQGRSRSGQGGVSLGRSRPGYSSDRGDRDFDEKYRELFTAAREELQSAKVSKTSGSSS